jgi:hypothetical protein
MESVQISDKTSLDLTEKDSEVASQSVTNEKPAEPKPSHPDVWALKTSEDPRDQIRLGLFLQLLDKLTLDITNRLPEFQKKNPDVFLSRKKLYQYSPDLDNDERESWIRTNWKLISEQFYTRAFSGTLHRKRLVSNVVRHCPRWLNNHLQLEKPLYCERKNVTVIESHVKKTKNITYISF